MQTVTVTAVGNQKQESTKASGNVGRIKNIQQSTAGNGNKNAKQHWRENLKMQQSVIGLGSSNHHGR